MSTEQQKQNITVNEFIKKLEILYGQLTMLVISLSWTIYLWPSFGRRKPNKAEMLENNVGYYYFLFFRVRLYKDVCVKYNENNSGKKDTVFDSKKLRDKTKSFIDKLIFKSKSKVHVDLRLINECIVSFKPQFIFQLTPKDTENKTYNISYGTVYNLLFFELAVVKTNTVSVETALEISKQVSDTNNGVNMTNSVQEYYSKLLQQNSSELEDLMNRMLNSDEPDVNKDEDNEK